MFNRLTLVSSSLYAHGDDQVENNEATEEQELKVVKIFFGYSRAQRLDLISTGDRGIRLYIRIRDRNESYQK